MRLVNAATVQRAEKVLRRADCPASVAVQDVVRVSGPQVAGRLQVELADPLAVPFLPAVGVVVRKFTATLCLVQSTGPMRGVFSGLSPGALYYLGVGGTLVAAAPASPARVQVMGVAWDVDELLLQWYDEGGSGGSGGDFDVDRILVLRWNPHDPPVHEEPSIAIEASSGNVMVIRP
jgi:hypothetical protein